jgi:5'-nucleotidase
MNDEKLILVVNDDGITAPGIKALVQAVMHLGKVVVVAPDKPQSGMGHAITIGNPLRLQKVEQFVGIESYQCSGTPVDCVKLAVDKVFHRKPDLCVSGINHGSNSSINIIYSGTMSAAMEAAIEGIPAIGFSLLDYSFEANFEAAQKIASTLAQKMLSQPWPVGTLWNVNIPKLGFNKIKGIKACRQAKAKWEEEYDERADPSNKKYYWMTGKFINQEATATDTDESALAMDYVSLVPVQFDLTNYEQLKNIQSLIDK